VGKETSIILLMYIKTLDIPNIWDSWYNHTLPANETHCIKVTRQQSHQVVTPSLLHSAGTLHVLQENK